MDCNQFQDGALRTWKSTDPLVTRRVHAALGLVGEAGEVSELVKKITFHDHNYPPILIEKELGDVLYYLAVLAAEFGLRLGDVAASNQAKLLARYPDGYSDQASKERRDVTD